MDAVQLLNMFLTEMFPDSRTSGVHVFGPRYEMALNRIDGTVVMSIEGSILHIVVVPFFEVSEMLTFDLSDPGTNPRDIRNMVLPILRGGMVRRPAR